MALILFDFDGVLADTLGDMLRFAQEVCNELGIQHLVTQGDLSNLEVMSFAEYGRACEVPEQMVEEFVCRCTRKFGAKKSPPAIFEKLDEIVRKLSASHILGVVTGNTKQNVKTFLVEHELDDRIRAVYGVDSPGSKSEKISLAQTQFAVENEAVFMVGDSLSDIRAARQAGVKSIAVSWGHQSLEMLIRAAPDYLVHLPQELLELLEKLASN
ncbi:MAG: HAD family hydrolase [Anaerolineaceae bacterium]|nr:MAG: HAD family hydrolase [Anaerolineaceae bacterium]